MPDHPPIYVEALRVVVRQTDRPGDSAPASALVGAFDIGDDLPLDALVDELERWLVQRGREPFEIGTRRSRAHVGASGSGTEIAIWFLSAGGAVAIHEVWEYLKRRLPRGEEAVRRQFDWLRRLDPDELPDQLGWMLARSLDARRAELRLVEIARGEDEIRGTFETSTGERYLVRATDEVFLISRSAGDEPSAATSAATAEPLR